MIWQVDIVQFQSTQCEGKGCDFVWHEEAGVGAIINDWDNGIRAVQHCCTQEAVDNALCDFSDLGKLIIETKEGVFHRRIDIPSSGSFDKFVNNAKSYRPPGTYVVIMAYCNPDGRPVHVDGTWKFHLHDTDDAPAAIATPVDAPVAAPVAPTSQVDGIDSTSDGPTTDPMVWALLSIVILAVCFTACNRYMYDAVIVGSCSNCRRTSNPDKVQSRQDVEIDFSSSHGDDNDIGDGGDGEMKVNEDEQFHDLEILAEIRLDPKLPPIS